MKKLTMLLTFIACIGIQISMAQTVKVSGTITSSDDKQPLIGATVIIKGTAVGVLTDSNGKYSIDLPASAQTLQISFIGYKTIEIATAGRTIIDVELKSESTNVAEVVVTALGISREKKALGYSVQDVSGNDISGAQQPDIINALNGRVAGVQITNSAGVVGGSTYITIRGVNSITGETQPLFVVDGVPIDNSMIYSGNPDNGVNNGTAGTAFANRESDLNPDDIETVSVLKGGAATALYGLQAANGVVMITTKKGSKSKENTYSANFSSTVELSQVSQLPLIERLYSQGSGGKYQGPDIGGGSGTNKSWGEAISGLRYDGSSYPWDKNGAIVLASEAPNGKPVVPYDNEHNFFQTGASYSNAINFAGGNENANFFLSYSNLTSTGIVPLNTYNKNTFKISGESKIGKIFKIFGSVNYINTGGNGVQQGSNLSGVMLGLLRSPITFDLANGKSNPSNRPTAYEFVADGTQRNYVSAYDNPFWSVNMNKTQSSVDRIIGVYGFTITPSNWISINYRFGNDIYFDRRYSYFAINSQGGTDPGLGSMFNDDHFNSIINSDLTVNLKKDITSDLKGNLLLGQNMYQNYAQQLYVEGDGFSIPNYYELNNTSSQLTRQNEGEKRTAALYADLSLSYKDLLFLDVTGRNEWSTTLPQANNSFFFPSVSLGFIFTELPSLKNDVLTYGKLRASYAETANDAPTYLTVPFYSLNTITDGWGQSANISPPLSNNVGSGVNAFGIYNVFANPILKPEFTYNTEFGVDLSFYKRLQLNITYFNNQNHDQIIEVPLAGSSGANYQYMNIGKMENKGIEITANLILFNTNDFNWNFTVNYTQIKNTVIALAPNVPSIQLAGFTGTTIEAVEGQPFGEIYATDFVRDSKGRAVIDDVPGDNTYGQPIASSNESALGSYLPKWTGTLSNSLTYKGFNIDFLLEFKNGGLMWNGTQSRLVGFGVARQTEDRGSSEIYPGVLGHLDASGNIVSSGTANNIPFVKNQTWYSTVGGGANPVQSQFVQKTDWLRLRTLTLGYTFNSKILGAGNFIKKLSVFATGKNLLLKTPYTGVDPETSLFGAIPSQGIDYFNMPGTKSYVFGIKLGF